MTRRYPDHDTPAHLHARAASAARAASFKCTYTAPPVNVPRPNPAVIKVASAADPSKFATANVTVTDTIAVTLSPASASVALSGTQVFTATISNTTDTGLSWYVNGVLNGDTAQGTLTAGTGALEVHLHARRSMSPAPTRR